ncbi:MAG: tetratricopeptide repeat protein [Rhodospirillales bacterium]|nr:tetratricopeptide repeat protein [Rhodospirillales bacterium]
MTEPRRSPWHAVREFATHWLIGGAILAATGFVPEEWLARLLAGLRVPADALHLWGAGMDLRVLLVGAGSAAVVGDVAWRSRRRTARAEVGTQATIAPDPPVATAAERPSIAVLPFANLSHDPDQEFFSDGIADDIITELSRSRVLFVIARNSSFTYRGRSVDVREVARELGVRYVLEGSARRDGTALRVNAQLIDAETGTHVWAERYDRAVTDMFAMQDEITRAVVLAIRPAVAEAELRRALRRPPESLGAWEAYQRALGLMSRLNLPDTQKAEALLRRAIALDSTFGPAYGALSHSEGRQIVIGAAPQIDAALRSSEAHSRRAVELDPHDADAHAALANVLTMRGEWDAGLAEARSAVGINPDSANAVRSLGTSLLFAGHPVEARVALTEALRLSPRDPFTYIALSQITLAHYQERDYDAAIGSARRAMAEQPENILSHRYLAAALGQLGRTEEARVALARAISLAPRTFDFYVRARPPWYRPELYDHLLDGLRKAGWSGAASA